MPAQVHHDDDADLSLIQGRSVAVIGDTDQGLAQALCLRDSGVDVVLGVADDDPGRVRAQEEGLRVSSPSQVAEADVVVLADTAGGLRSRYADAVSVDRRSGTAVIFGSGYPVRYGVVRPPADVDVAVVAPVGSADRVRRQYVDGKGVPVLVAIGQDATGEALPLALSYAKAIGGTRAGAIQTSVEEQTEAALFGGQAVLGGVAALVRSGFEVLTEAGCDPEVAYLACLHELTSAVAAMSAGGLAGMRAALPPVTGYGVDSRGPRLVDGRVREELRRILDEIRSGEFARELTDEDTKGFPNLERWRAEAAAHPIEQAGQAARARMSWLDRPTL